MLLYQHAPLTLSDAAACVRRLAAEIPRLQDHAGTIEAADFLNEVVIGRVDQIKSEAFLVGWWGEME